MDDDRLNVEGQRFLRPAKLADESGSSGIDFSAIVSDN